MITIRILIVGDHNSGKKTFTNKLKSDYNIKNLRYNLNYNMINYSFNLNNIQKNKIILSNINNINFNNKYYYIYKNIDKIIIIVNSNNLPILKNINKWKKEILQ